jgi:cell filamentation protein
MPDPYLIPGTVVLQNKLGISDFDELEQAVADIGDAMAYRLFDKNTPVPATLAGWRAVHKAMFGSVFEWAGDFRNVNIRKSGDDDSSDGFFAPYGRLVADGQRAVRNLENTVRRIQTAKISLIADNLADVYDQLKYLHPFREGNGRSQKVFFSLVCRPRGLQLNWSEIPSNEHNLAAQQAMRGDISLLRKHFQSIVAKSASPSLALHRRGSSD